MFAYLQLSDARRQNFTKDISESMALGERATKVTKNIRKYTDALMLGWRTQRGWWDFRVDAKNLSPEQGLGIKFASRPSLVVLQDERFSARRKIFDESGSSLAQTYPPILKRYWGPASRLRKIGPTSYVLTKG